MVTRANRSSGSSSGFTLVETVLALGIAATVLLPLVALLGHAMDQTAKITTTDRILRLSEALEQRLASEPFELTYKWATSDQPMFVYAYAGTLEGRRDGTAYVDGAGSIPSTGTPLDQKRTYVVARPFEERIYIEQEAAVVEGRMFRVELKPSKLNSVEQFPLLPQTYPGAALAIEAKFYSVANKYDFATSPATYEMSLHYVINR